MKAFLIIVIVILVIAIGVGAYFIIKETIKPVTTSPTTSSTTSASVSASATASSSDLEKAYDEAKDVEASTTKSKTVDGEVKPILKNVFADQVKLSEDMAGSLLTYITNREITAEDVTTVKTKMEAAGYKTIDSSEKKMTMTKGATTLVFTFTVGDKTKAMIEVTL